MKLLKCFLLFIFHHMCYRRSEVKICNTIGIKGINYQFQNNGFLPNAINFFLLVKYLKKITQFEKEIKKAYGKVEVHNFCSNQ